MREAALGDFFHGAGENDLRHVVGAVERASLQHAQPLGQHQAAHPLPIVLVIEVAEGQRRDAGHGIAAQRGGHQNLLRRFLRKIAGHIRAVAHNLVLVRAVGQA